MMGPNNVVCRNLESKLRECQEAVLGFIAELDAEKDGLFKPCDELSDNLNHLTFLVQKRASALEKVLKY